MKLLGLYSGLKRANKCSNDSKNQHIVLFLILEFNTTMNDKKSDCYLALTEHNVGAFATTSTVITAAWPQRIKLRQVITTALTDQLAQITTVWISVCFLLKKDSESNLGNINVTGNVDYAEPCYRVIWSHYFMLGPYSTTVATTPSPGVNTVYQGAPNNYQDKEIVDGNFINMGSGDEILIMFRSSTVAVTSLLRVQHMWDIYR